MAIKVTVSRKGNGLNTLAGKVHKRVTAKIGFMNNPEMVKRAERNEYGWVQQVTNKQSWFFKQNFGIEVKPHSVLSSPPRPFMRYTLRDYGDTWKAELAKGLEKNGLNELFSVMLGVASLAQSHVQETINRGGTPKTVFERRSELTMKINRIRAGTTASGNKRKVESSGNLLRSRALMDTGEMKNAVSYEVS